MKRRLQQLIAVVWIVAGAAAALAGPSTHTLGVYNATPEERQSPSVRTYFTAPTENEEEIEAFRQRLIEQGARNVNWFGTNVIVCDLPATKDFGPLLSAPRFAGFVPRDESQVPDYIPGRSESFLSQVKSAYAAAERLADPSTPTATPGDDFVDVVRVIPPEEVRQIQAEIEKKYLNRQGRSSAGPNETMRNVAQNSEILTGSVKAYLIFPESNGSIDPKTETWLNDVGSENQDYLDARTHAFAALIDWQGQFPQMGLSFRVIDLMPECDYEPIHHNMSTDDLWQSNVMHRLDPDLSAIANPVSAVHVWNEERRGGYDWIYTAFIARSQNEPTHRFRGANYTAYANLGGPFLVNPYPAGGDPNQIGENLVYSQIVQHETGHIFWTLDEYPGAPGTCATTSGYLNYANQNINIEGPAGIVRCIPEIECIMNQASRRNVGRPFCKWSRGHMSVIDNNDNAIPDVFEAPPLIRFDPPTPDTVDVADVTIYIKAISQAVPNNNTRQDPEFRRDYAAPLKGGEFGLGGLSTFPLYADDGDWDGDLEEAHLEFNSLPPGETVFKFRVRNSVGMYSGWYEKRIFFMGVAYGRFTVTPDDGHIEVQWEKAGGAASAEFDVYRLEPDDPEPNLRMLGYDDEMPGTLVVENAQADAQSVGNWFTVRDHEVAPGVRYRYYITGYGIEQEGTPDERSYRSTTVAKGQTAMVPIPRGTVISYAAPNPSSGEVTFSVSVPRPDPRSVATGQEPDPTSVQVKIYDVLGRLVKEIRNGRERESVLTLRWDGKTSQGVQASSGIYFIRVKAGDAVATRKVLLIR